MQFEYNLLNLLLYFYVEKLAFCVIWPPPQFLSATQLSCCFGVIKLPNVEF